MEQKSLRLRFFALASGSRGNALFVSNGRTSVLIDAGLSGKELERRMSAHGLEPASLDAIVLSHEHNDHVRGAGVLSRRFGLPVHLARRTMGACEKSLGALEEVHYFTAGNSFCIGGLNFFPFTTSHDAAEPTGFTVCANGAKLGIATDLGVATANVRHALTGCGALYLEANHDVPMLMSGPYPWHLKQRVKSRVGHLSNEASRDLLAGLVHSGLRHVMLGHLSETNNLPEKALNTVSQALGGAPRIRLTVACQHSASEMVII